MRKNAGVAQILLPGFDLQDISLPKDSAKKEAMLKMYSDAMKTALAGITSIDELDIEDEDDPTFTDDIMEKIERGEIDLEEYLAQVSFCQFPKGYKGYTRIPIGFCKPQFLVGFDGRGKRKETQKTEIVQTV